MPRNRHAGDILGGEEQGTGPSVIIGLVPGGVVVPSHSKATAGTGEAHALNGRQPEDESAGLRTEPASLFLGVNKKCHLLGVFCNLLSSDRHIIQE